MYIHPEVVTVHTYMAADVKVWKRKMMSHCAWHMGWISERSVGTRVQKRKRPDKMSVAEHAQMYYFLHVLWV
jgi:hypothetical protein